MAKSFSRMRHHPIEMSAGSVHQLRAVGKDHQGILFLRLVGPVKEKAVGLLFVTLLEDRHEVEVSPLKFADSMRRVAL